MHRLQLFPVAVVLLLQACSNTLSSSSSTAASDTKAVASAPQSQVERLLDAPAYMQRQAIMDKKISVEALTQAYIERIRRLDARTQSVIAINPEAITQAQAKDAELARGQGQPGALFGLPVLLKDNIETQQLPTTAGSMALANNDTRRDAPLVHNLRQAGAIILGKTNLSEWANFRSEASVSGWSAIGGLTRNPYNLSRSACGSSSGSGAAMAADFAALAVGTETNGSIICPASFNGIVGYKPTVGLISRRYVVPISHSQDTAGPMVKSVTDAILMAKAMAGEDPRDTATVTNERVVLKAPEQLSNGLKGVKVGVVRFAQGDDERVLQQYNQALTTLEQQGAKLVEITAHQMPEAFWENAYHVLLAEFKTGINEYLAEVPNPLPATTLSGLIAYNEQSSRELGLFNQDIFEQAQATEGAQGTRYQQASNMVITATTENGIDKLLEQHQVDLLVAPSNAPAFLIDTLYGDHAPGGFIGIGYMAAIAGYPHVSVPAGLVNGMPVGLSFIGAKWQDNQVLAAGLAFEKGHAPIPAPQFLHSDAELEQHQQLLKPVQP
ncbi:amidase [Salinimonas marina]|uniref:Amidase n=1 Tax=Salinimonas marina TaxID=2785918 RepID=A0A7S9HCX5_9ALTE|nr:amidase [Salinimonas marina]QPG05554.1 amidase [Salinimonas marina]